MAVTSNRSVLITFTGDVEYSQTFTAGTNSSGSGNNGLINLSSGNNTITVPTGAVAVTFIPPANNTQTMILKGNSGDTGFAISKTDPCSPSLDGSGDSLVIDAGGSITGLRIIFS